MLIKICCILAIIATQQTDISAQITTTTSTLTTTTTTPTTTTPSTTTNENSTTEDPLLIGFTDIPTQTDNVTIVMTTSDPVLVEATQAKVETQIAKLSRQLPFLTNCTYDLLNLYLKIRKRQVDHVASATRQIDNQIQRVLKLLTTDDDMQSPKSGIDVGYCTFATDYGVPEILDSLRTQLLAGLTNSSDEIFEPALQNVTQCLRGVLFIKNFIRAMPETMEICADYADQLGCLNDILLLRYLYVPKHLRSFVNNKMVETETYVLLQMSTLGDNYRETISIAKTSSNQVVDNVTTCINNSI